MLSIGGINTHGIIRRLDASLRSQSSAMEKLSSGLRINKAADDPAGLVISEQLRSQISGLERAIHNTEEADNVLGIMEGALGIVQGVLTGMRKLTVQAANTGVSSPDQIAALQAEMDASLQSISRIMETTSLGGRKLLDHLQNEGKLGLGSTASEPETAVDAADHDGKAGADGDAGKAPARSRIFPVDADGNPISGLAGSAEGAVLSLDPDGNAGADDPLARRIAKLSEKDRALYNLGSGFKDFGMSSLGSITLPEELGGLLPPKTLTLEDLYSGSAASLSKDPLTAMRIVEQAGRDVRNQRAQIGATRRLSENARAAMAAQLENTTRVESGIRDTDFAVAMTEYVHSQLLSQTGLRMLDAVMEQNRSILDILTFEN